MRILHLAFVVSMVGCHGPELWIGGEPMSDAPGNWLVIVESRGGGSVLVDVDNGSFTGESCKQHGSSPMSCWLCVNEGDFSYRQRALVLVPGDEGPAVVTGKLFSFAGCQGRVLDSAAYATAEGSGAAGQSGGGGGAVGSGGAIMVGGMAGGGGTGGSGGSGGAP